MIILSRLRRGSGYCLSLIFPQNDAFFRQISNFCRRGAEVFPILETYHLKQAQHSGNATACSLHSAPPRATGSSPNQLIAASVLKISDVTVGVKQNTSGRSSAWLERRVWDAEVARSNRVAPTFLQIKPFDLKVDRLFLFRRVT